jgi:hypothetical protein
MMKFIAPVQKVFAGNSGQKRRDCDVLFQNKSVLPQKLRILFQTKVLCKKQNAFVPGQVIFD